MIQYLETDCEICLQNVEALEKENPIYKCLRRRVILGMSLYWNVLQDHCRRRWLFWRSNSSMQRVWTPSCWFRFQNLLPQFPARTLVRTIYSSSYHTISWHSCNWNSDSIHDNAESKLLGNDMSREESLRGWVTCLRSRTQSQEYGITFRKICCKRNWTLFYRVGAIPHRGNSCDAVRNSDESSVLFKRSYSSWWKEVEWHFCLQVFQRRLSSSRISQNWSWDWHVVVIKMNEKLTTLFN